MLILSRKKNEAIVLNNDIMVTVIEIRGDKVRLGIEAPREASVHRHEVWACMRQDEVLHTPESPRTVAHPDRRVQG